jgi:hypothetical protein
VTQHLKDMIYDPTRAARNLRQRILETMSGEEMEKYARESQPSYASHPNKKFRSEHGECDDQSHDLKNK